MRSSTKMTGMIMLIGLCILFYQYKLSIDAYEARNLRTSEYLEHYTCQKITEKIIRLAVRAVRKINGRGPDMINPLIQELNGQLGKIFTSPLYNEIYQDVKERQVLPVEESAMQIPRYVLPYKSEKSTLDPLYIITPTFVRPEQIPELTRMSHTLMLVENIHWLVIEDANSSTPQVTKLLERTGLVFEHLVAPMPEKFRRHYKQPRGVSNRNRGLQWIRANATRGVVYFADDDNTYDIDLFEEIRRTKKVSMFPVGLCTKFRLSSPIVRNGKFAGFYDGWIAGRKFPVDMAGFAVSVEFLLNRPNAMMPYRLGCQEDGFLKSLAPLELPEIELLADNCTRILVWHTQTRRQEPGPPLDMELYSSTNLIVLKQQIQDGSVNSSWGLPKKQRTHKRRGKMRIC